MLLPLLLLSSFQALLGIFRLVGGGVSIHDTHVVNTVHNLLPEVSNEEIPFQLPIILRRGPF